MQVNLSFFFYSSLQVPVRDVDLTVLTQAFSAPVIAVASPSAVRYVRALVNILVLHIIRSFSFPY